MIIAAKFAAAALLASIGMAGLAGTASAGTWHANAAACPDLREDRFDARHFSGRGDRRDRSSTDGVHGRARADPLGRRPHLPDSPGSGVAGQREVGAAYPYRDGRSRRTTGLRLKVEAWRADTQGVERGASC